VSYQPSIEVMSPAAFREPVLKTIVLDIDPHDGHFAESLDADPRRRRQRPSV
jgi:hypothetical protein